MDKSIISFRKKYPDVKIYFEIFKEWKGEPIKNSYGGKKGIDFNGEPLFAELAVLKLFQSKGWNGV